MGTYRRRRKVIYWLKSRNSRFLEVLAHDPIRITLRMAVFALTVLSLLFLVVLIPTTPFTPNFVAPSGLQKAHRRSSFIVTSSSSTSLNVMPKPFDDDQGLSRRTILSMIAVSLPLITCGSSALAEVSAGNSLPAGAAQFASVLKSQRDAAAVVKSLTTSPPTEEGQWKVLSLFIRGFYTAGDDMLYLAKVRVGRVVRLGKWRRAESEHTKKTRRRLLTNHITLPFRRPSLLTRRRRRPRSSSSSRRTSRRLISPRRIR